MKKLTRDQWYDRAEAYNEAAEHLGLDWCETESEREQGDVVQKVLRRLADSCRKKAVDT